MKISIALATYNGEPFLHQQLESFARQTRLPDEVVVCDDASTDRTVDILRAFAASAPFPVHIHPNDHNLGVAGNFSMAFSLCSGDVIAPADQDDVWYPHKLATFEQALADHPEVGLVFGDGDLADEGLRSLGLTMWQYIKLSPRVCAELDGANAFERLLARNYVTGAMCAFRADCRDLILPISDGSLHDYWFTLIIAANARLLPLDAPLMQYRQHRQNVIGAQPRSLAVRARRALRIDASKYDARCQMFEQIKEHLAGMPRFREHPRWPELLDEKVQHERVRARPPRSRLRRTWVILREVARGRYRRFSINGNLSALRDLLAP